MKTIQFTIYTEENQPCNVIATNPTDKAVFHAVLDKLCKYAGFHDYSAQYEIKEVEV